MKFTSEIHTVPCLGVRAYGVATQTHPPIATPRYVPTVHPLTRT